MQLVVPTGLADQADVKENPNIFTNASRHHCSEDSLVLLHKQNIWDFLKTLFNNYTQQHLGKDSLPTLEWWPTCFSFLLHQQVHLWRTVLGPPWWAAWLRLQNSPHPADLPPLQADEMGWRSVRKSQCTFVDCCGRGRARGRVHSQSGHILWWVVTDLSAWPPGNIMQRNIYLLRFLHGLFPTVMDVMWGSFCCINYVFVSKYICTIFSDNDIPVLIKSCKIVEWQLSLCMLSTRGTTVHQTVWQESLGRKVGIVSPNSQNVHFDHP